MVSSELKEIQSASQIIGSMLVSRSKRQNDLRRSIEASSPKRVTKLLRNGGNVARRGEKTALKEEGLEKEAGVDTSMLNTI